VTGADGGWGGVPRNWERLLAWLVPATQRDAVLGDAEEDFRARFERHGAEAARRWYRRQVLRSAIPGLAHRMRAALAAWRDSEREGETMRAWMTDSRLALRALRRRPGFSLTVLITLALGVGATTALFGVFRTVFLEPVPLPDPDRLVIVMEQGSFGCCGPASGPDYLDWAKRNRSFSGMALLNIGTYTITGLDQPQRIVGTYVTASAFDMLGVAPLKGRALLPEDERAPGVVVVSWSFWQNQMGGRRDVLNTTVEIDGAPYTVVGVMPEDFDVPTPWTRMGSINVYLPFQSDRIAANDRGSHGWPVIARMAPGVTKEGAQADMDRIMRELAQEYPQTNADRSTKVFTVHEYLYAAVGKQLGMILGAAGLVLLIACGNVAGLLLARAASRETELAVRAALGASRRAMVRLLFSEALVLALLGGLGGILFSYVAIDGLKSLLPPSIPRIDRIRVDGAALAFALGASAFAALVFGMIPSLVASRTGLAANVKEGGYATLAPAKERLRNAFIVGQIALGLVLANGAALLVRSYVALRGQEYGFQPAGVITMSLNPAGPRYDSSNVARLAYYDEIAQKVSALPGVETVGTISRLPLNGGSNGNVWVEGTPPRKNSGEGPLVEVTSVTGDYFEAMGIPLLKGRRLQPEDSLLAATNVLINQRMADVAWPGQDPLGKRFSFDDNPPFWLTVVGVVGNVRQWGPEQPPQAQTFAPFARGWSYSMYLTVRASGDLDALVPRIRQTVLSVDPTQPPSDVRMMKERVERTFAQRRFYTTLIALFAVAALFLAAAGVYGTVSYFVARRIRELGIRMALGAAATGILGLVVRRGIMLAVWGVAIGLIGVWASTRLLEGMVYGIHAVDPLTMTAGSLALASVAVVASAIPAARAVRVSPVTALRAE
jgi:putative ABC transport system permease protein